MNDDVDTKFNESQHRSQAAAPGAGNKRLRLLLITVAALAIIAAGIWLVRYIVVGQYQETTNDAYIQSDAIAIAPKVSGYVDRVFVTENQAVKAGQPLVQIDPRDYSAQSAQALAQIEIAQASAAGARAQIEEQAAAIERARAELAAAQEAAAQAASQVNRYRPLAATGAETGERLSQLESEAKRARAEANAAQASLASAQHHVATLRAQEQQALAQADSAKARLAAAKTDVEATILRASANGRIGNKGVRQGQFVQAATRLMSLVPDKSLYVTANFKETQLGLMRPGQPVKVEVDALPDLELNGRIESIAPGTGAQFSILPPQNATGNFTKIVQRVPVRISIDIGPETRRALVPGMSVEVSVDTRSARKAAERMRDEQERHNARLAR